MTKVRLAFYKHTGKPINWLIAYYTALFNPTTPPYSHVEIGLFCNDKWNYFSSTLREGAKGTRWISEKSLFKHPERWDVYEYDADKSLETMKMIIKKMIPAKYDLLGIFGFVTLFGLPNSKKDWYCSEAVWYVLKSWKKRISPSRLYSNLKSHLDPVKINIDK